MQHGWQQFYRDQSLRDDELLLFRHNDNMYFDVQVFDKSGCERKNVSITRTHQDSVMEIKEEEMDITEIEETKPQVQTRRNGKRKSTEEKIQALLGSNVEQVEKLKQNLRLRISAPSSLISSTA